MPLRAELVARLSAVHTKSDQDFGTQAPKYDFILEKILQLTSGTGANQADVLFSDRRTLTASATEDLDLAGVLTDAFGATVAAAEVVAILVIADPANTNNVVIGNATQPVPLFSPSTATYPIGPGGFFFACSPGTAGMFTVGAGATDDLKVANSAGGTSVIYDIVIIGRTV